MKKSFLILFALILSTLSFAQEKQLTKFEQITSQTGRIVKLQDVYMPSMSLFLGGGLKASIRLVMGDEEFFFYRLEKPETSSSLAKIAMIEYADLVEINKALKVLSASVASDISADPDYLENKFRTEDGLEVGYYVSSGKANWFIKLERYSSSTVFPKSEKELISNFEAAQIKMEELMASR